MTDKTAEPITIIERFELLASFSEVEEAITALARRVAEQAAAGLVTYRFYYDAHDREVSLLMDLAAGEAFVAHRERVTNWAEWRDFDKMVERTGTLIFGNPGEELEAYLLEQRIEYDWAGQPVAGFTR